MADVMHVLESYAVEQGVKDGEGGRHALAHPCQQSALLHAVFVWYLILNAAAPALCSDADSSAATFPLSSRCLPFCLQAQCGRSCWACGGPRPRQGAIQLPAFYNAHAAAAAGSRWVAGWFPVA